MNKLALALITTLFALSSCTVTKDISSDIPNQIWWVSGFKTECDAGAAKMNCLNIHKNEDINNPTWENHYSNIEGFEFEAGFLKKIEVKMEKIDPKDVPADASSIKYTLVKEIEKSVDYRMNINGEWTLSRFKDKPINSSIPIPTMKINLNQMQVNGSGGCNKYFGAIEKLTTNTIQFGAIAGTRMACFNNDIERDYLKALNTVNTYQIKGSNLIFYNATGNKVLSYTKEEDKVADQRIHDIWATIRINGNTIEKTIVPRLEINLTKNRVFGNDGCNEYFGSITAVSASKIKFGALAGTKKLCRDMAITNSFNTAMRNVASYKLKGMNLILMDEKGKEILAFLKID